MKVIVIGAAGRVGSQALESCLKRGHETTAFLRTPSKLPARLREYSNLTIFQGDAMVKEDVVKAIQGHDAIIQCAVFGSLLPWGDQTDVLNSTKIISNVVDAAVDLQSARSSSSSLPPLRFWNVAGEVLLDFPHPRAGKKNWIQGDVIYVHPEHYRNYDYVVKHAGSLDWSVMCPAGIKEGEPAGPIELTTDKSGLWSDPFIIGRLPFFGPILNLVYNWLGQHLTYKGIGEALADNLGPGGQLHHKRVGVLENRYAKK